MPIFQHEHDAEKQRQIVAGSRAPCFRASTGLKGFVNMGSTCFMSSVLQTLIHNPFIRDYFLAGSHSDCGKMGAECLSCSVADIFQDFYSSPSAAGYGPVSLLTAAWKVKRSLAGYSEQDAHEFWQFLLHQLHKNDTKKSSSYKEHTPVPGDHQSPAHGSCNCIIHRTFAGELQSSIRRLQDRHPESGGLSGHVHETRAARRHLQLLRVPETDQGHQTAQNQETASDSRHPAQTVRASRNVHQDRHTRADPALPQHVRLRAGRQQAALRPEPVRAVCRGVPHRVRQHGPLHLHGEGAHGGVVHVQRRYGDQGVSAGRSQLACVSALLHNP
ncbi:hypothetical protein KL928_004809 [Ogataea angusta]|uniref:ubiquitinyl hydrolase 1 n=1 Tax=Pichia angusta TaxID=870730 RepID=A0AAN6I443_PICAN|nr:uncharacterized protein KL928_004809 [Ogataea angusta]KAG7816253.1 hypothetical protein KL928_004809 [Ogataea angusta]